MTQIDIIGRHSVADALNSDKKIINLFVATSAKADPEVSQILKLAEARNIPIQSVSNDDLVRRFNETNPQGIVAVVDLGEPPVLKQILADNRQPFLLVFPHFDYEQNLGAVMRSAWAAGVDAIIVGNSGIHEITPVVSKVSMGAAAYVPLISMSIFQALDQLDDAAVPLVGVEVAKGESYSASNLTGGIALVFGGEAAGITDPVAKRCQRFVHIPMKGSLASLNISVATAVILFEKLRQENK